jgi:hypothetical protein
VILRKFVPEPLRKLKRQVYVRLRAGDESIPVLLHFMRLGIDPTDAKNLAKAAHDLFDKRQAAFPPGTVERGRFLLQLIANSHPTARLSDAYFENLTLLLRSRPTRSVPGRIILGIGSGRSGSTTLSAFFASLDDSCATHENPPLIGWAPDEAEITFHLRRFDALRRHYQIVSDVSHWWLNAIDFFLNRFPEGKIIGLYRDVESCARSFSRIKGEGRNSMNHWAGHGNCIWSPNIWDQTYPTYPVPERAIDHPDEARLAMIRRYVEEYNDRMKAMAARHPGSIVLFPTEDLNRPEVTARLCEIAGVPARTFDRKLNVNNVHEGEAIEFIM